jgi:hypothetical protein
MQKDSAPANFNAQLSTSNYPPIAQLDADFWLPCRPQPCATAGEFWLLDSLPRRNRVKTGESIPQPPVPTYRFNEASKRNRERFPDDFAFQLTAKEFAVLRSQMTAANSSQIAMSPSQAVESEGSVPSWSQFVTSSKRHTSLVVRSQIVT